MTQSYKNDSLPDLDAAERLAQRLLRNHSNELQKLTSESCIAFIAEVRRLREFIRPAVTDNTDTLRNALDDNKRLREAFDWILPLAKAYAHSFPVGRNTEIVQHAEEVAGNPAEGDQTQTKQEK